MSKWLSSAELPAARLNYNTFPGTNSTDFRELSFTQVHSRGEFGLPILCFIQEQETLRTKSYTDCLTTGF